MFVILAQLLKIVKGINNHENSMDKIIANSHESNFFHAVPSDN